MWIARSREPQPELDPPTPAPPDTTGPKQDLGAEGAWDRYRAAHEGAVAANAVEIVADAVAVTISGIEIESPTADGASLKITYSIGGSDRVTAVRVDGVWIEMPL